MKKKSVKLKVKSLNLVEKAKKVKLLILDVDGVMTDGSIILDNSGNEFKVFHVRDGHGIKMLVRAGINVAIITGRESQVVERRAGELGIADVYQNYLKKIEAYEKLKEKYSLKDDEIACIADDVVDLPIMKCAGLSFAVADAVVEVRKHAAVVTKNKGGRCAVREAVEIMLKAKGLWNGIVNNYLSEGSCAKN